MPASADLRAAVRAALAGAALTGGLADPTLLGALERAGYARLARRAAARAARPALAAAPARRAARRTRAARWRRVTVGDGRSTRPPGLRLDLGGSAKGFIADRVAALLAPGGPCAVDCGGDMRVHGDHAVAGPPSADRRGRGRARRCTAARSPPRASTPGCGARRRATT